MIRLVNDILISKLISCLKLKKLVTIILTSVAKIHSLNIMSSLEPTNYY